jgi:hypothetical protein
LLPIDQDRRKFVAIGRVWIGRQLAELLFPRPQPASPLDERADENIRVVNEVRC